MDITSNGNTSEHTSAETREAMIEADAYYLGERRYFQQDDLTELPPGKRLIVEHLPKLAQGIVEFVESEFTGRAGRKHTAVPYLVQIDPSEAAWLTLSCAVHYIAKMVIRAGGPPPRLQGLAEAVADSVEQHMNLKRLAKESGGLYRKVAEQVAKSTSERHRKGVWDHVARKYLEAPLVWEKREKFLVGSKLLELAEEHTGLVEIIRMERRNGRDTTLAVTLRDDAVDWIVEAERECSMLRPAYMPMVVAPRPWTDMNSGGYLLSRLRARLMIGGNAKRTEVLRADLSTVIDAVNTVQATAWQINGAVLDVLDALVHSGGGTAGLPATGDLPIPPRPLNIPSDVPVSALPDDLRETLNTWRRAASQAHTENGLLKAKRIELGRLRYLARRFRDEPAIYFPHRIDFRGRVYPMPEGLHPQGGDMVKGLLRFAEGKPLGDDGAFWLAVHIANLFGRDKMPFEDRVAWVQAHEDKLLAAALGPLDQEGAFWMEAENPWCALAACFEWAGYKVAGNAFVSHLPIAMDGSCSGLQHFSALLRDEVGGAAVNLVPADKPADIYTAVARRAQVLSDASDSGMAAAWAGKVTRKVAKQPTMTLCYAATRFGIIGQVKGALRGLNEEAGGRYLCGDVELDAAAAYMADTLMTAMGDVVVAARRAMDWLQSAATLAARAGKEIRWTSPLGLPVVQAYTDPVGERVTVFWRGQRMTITAAQDGSVLNPRRQAAGVCPNFVHSLDAAHLMSSVLLARENGLASFAVIHDSFGVHAADTSLMHAVLREAFAQQYRVNWLESLREELAEQIGPVLAEQLPTLPAIGSLDVEAIRDADYCFA